jgi:uncharacterized GH25 family protein
MKLRLPCLTTFALAAWLAAPIVHAHNIWMMPSATVLSKDGWITVDAAVANDLFYFNHVPMQLDDLSVTAPDSTSVTAENRHRGKLRSVFDVNLAQAGTYRIAVASHAFFATYTLNGERKRWRGRSVADLEREIPAGAEALVATESVRRIETFVTVGKPTALRPVGAGLELLPVTHPNDLVSGEPATFEMAIDGKPAARAKVVLIRGGTRYRDRLEEISVETGDDGRFTVQWPQPGMYWLEVVHEDDRVSSKKAAKRMLGYVATLEVLPQ